MPALLRDAGKSLFEPGMKKVLLIAYYFPPIAATGAMRPLQFCRHLSSYGWMPSVLATDASSALPPHPEDRKLLDVVPEDLSVTRIGHPDPRGRFLKVVEYVRHLRRQRRKADAPSETDVSTGKPVPSRSKAMLLNAAKLFTEASWEFPDLQSPWYRPATQALTRLSLEDRPDLIWATGRPWTGLLVGLRQARRRKVPFIADFRDPWVAGQQHETSEYRGSAKVLWKRAQRLERSICEGAARVILNTDELREVFCMTYPELAEKFVVIPNGYPEYLAERFKAVYRENGRRLQKTGTVEFSHFGTVYGGRKPLALLQAVDQLLREGKVEPGRMRLRFVGSWEVDDVTCERLAKDLEQKGVLQREQPVSHQQCLAKMANADYLLVLQAGFSLQIPAKIYEYIVADRPVLVIGGKGATENLVTRNNFGLCCPDHVESLKETLMALLSGRRIVRPPSPLDTAQFGYRELTGKLANVFGAVAGTVGTVRLFSRSA